MIVYTIFFCPHRPIIDRDIYYIHTELQQSVVYCCITFILYCQCLLMLQLYCMVQYLYNFKLIIRTQCTCTIFTTRYRVVKLWILQWNILYVPVLYVHYSTIVDFRYVLKYSRAFAIKTDGTTLFIPQFFSYRRGTYKILWNSEWNNPHCLFQIIPLPGYYHRSTTLWNLFL